VIAATHRALAAMVEAGTFRRDLFYRLCVFPIRVPPLRERLEELPALAATLIGEIAGRLGMAAPAPVAGVARAPPAGMPGPGTCASSATCSSRR
jgi:transcriptional regulator with GAF, ATPase, and Fis domain